MAVETFDQLKSGETVTDFVDRNVCKDGSHRWINWIVIPLPERNIAFGIGQDITERKQAEAALRESERRLCTLISNLPGMAYRSRSDRKWSMEFVSEGAFQLTGHKASDLIDNRKVAFGDLIHAADRKTVWDQVQEAIANRRRFQLEYRIRTAAGKERWVWEQGVGVFSDTGELQALEGLITDISERQAAKAKLKQSHEELERKVNERTTELVDANTSLTTEIQERIQAEELLRQSEAKYRAFAESSPDAVFITDLKGQLTFASRQAAELHGVGSPEEMIGRLALELVSKEERAKLRKNLGLLIEKDILRNNEYTALGKGGTTFPVETSSAVIRNAGGEPVDLMVVYRDITKRKQSQDALRKEQDALRRMLQASDRDRELLTYEIHDGVAQQLLGAIFHFEAVSQMERGIAGEVKAALDNGLAALRKASLEARDLMNRTHTPVFREFGFREAIVDLIDQVSNRPNAPEIAFRCETHFERLEPALENAIFRVAQEAIANACIHGKSELVRVTLIQEGDEVTVEVQDSGIGFDTAKVVEGRFGLDGIRERTRLLGKDLEIESMPGKGTRIRATFPLIYREEQTE